jgi:hypothetical protein
MRPCFLSLVTLAGLAALAADAADRKEDPTASKLLADARAARANWEKFPGFTAAIAVNLDGKISRGHVQVDTKGKVTFEGLDRPAEEWARRVLGSTVAHRMDGSATRNTPCAFGDADEHHPLGRLIHVLNDELHSSYRILDRQIMVVNRNMGPSRFTITMQENRTNAEGKFLPVSYVVNTWDNKTGALQRSEAHLQTWQRVGGFDLPAMTRVVAAVPEERTGGSQAAKDGIDARSLTLSQHKLSELGK